MKNYTLPDIIKIIPLQEDRRQELLASIDSLDDDRLYSLKETCWDLFFEYYQALADLKYQQLLQEAGQGKRKLTKGLMSDAYAAVHVDFQDILSGKKQELDEIDTIREKLKSLSTAAAAN